MRGTKRDRNHNRNHAHPSGHLAQNEAQRPSSKATPARRTAWEVLWYVHEHGCYLSEALKQVKATDNLPVEEAAFARLLATEVVARQGSLDTLINGVLQKPDDVRSNVRVALRISFCELFYLEKAPHAVVDQGVELVRLVEPKASRLANFALRRAVEQKDAFPFGDASADSAAAALQCGFPCWLEQRLEEEYGLSSTLQFMQRSNEPAPLFFMINTARADGAETLKTLVEAGCKIAPCQALCSTAASFPTFVFLERTAMAHPLVARLLAEGVLIVSDQAAQAISALAMPERAPEAMLEIGAGRGTKTILLQNVALARFGKQIALDTLDVNKQRTLEREKRLRRARISQRTALVHDATNLTSLADASYDAVFIDAPCSGVGTLRRHPDIRWRISSGDITQLADIGSRILMQAARLVKPGGRLVYATCTVFAQENDQVIKTFLASESGRLFENCDISVRDDCYTGEYGTMFKGGFSSQERGPVCDSHFVSVLQRRPTF